MSMQPISMGHQTRYEIDTKYLTEKESLVGHLLPPMLMSLVLISRLPSMLHIL